MPQNNLLVHTVYSSPNFINKVLEAQKVTQIVNDEADIEAKTSWLWNVWFLMSTLYFD